MKIKIAPLTNLEAGFMECSCKGCGKAVCHYDPDYIVIGSDVYHDVCLIAALTTIPKPGSFSCGCHHDGNQVLQNVCEMHQESARRYLSEGAERAHREWRAAISEAFSRHGITKSPTLPDAEVIEQILVETRA